jgi:Flp pilus assembly protein TadG
MMKKTGFRKVETAQIIPIVVIGLLVIIMFAALLVDGGGLLLNRRTAQAAADAGALAGARKLCAGDTSANRSLASSAANLYVTLNNATLEQTSFSTVVVSNTNVLGINVTASVTNPSFFAGIFGQDNLVAKATATAGCYHPSVTTHIMPIAFYFQTPPIKANNADCSDITKPCTLINWDYTGLLDTLRATSTNDLPLDDIYIVADKTKVCEKRVPGEIICTDMKSNVAGGNRTWLDFTLLADMSNLAKVIKEGVSKPLALPSWLNGIPGTNSAVYGGENYSQLDPIQNYEDLAARLVIMPVFNKFCASNPAVNCADPGDNFEYLVKVNSDSYRLSGLAPFIVTCTMKSGKCEFGDCLPANTGINTTSKPMCPGFAYALSQDPDISLDKSSIEGYFVDNSPMDIYIEGTAGVDAGLDVVSLTK